MRSGTKTALLSVYHKDGIIEFAQSLIARGDWEILASGGTAKALAHAGVRVKNIESVVGEAILGHRVVTLSREIHAGILARNIPEDDAELKKMNLPRIDLVCVDLYPLHETIRNPASTRQAVIDMTDVGGPTMLHSGAKGERIVICDPEDRMKFIQWLEAGSPNEEEFIDTLAAKADAVVSEYCLVSSNYRSHGRYDGILGTLIEECKYGENAWQTPAALYGAWNDNDPLALSRFTVIEGTAPSYNNFCDIDRMLQTITHIAAAFDVNRGMVPDVAVAVKHGNACGAAAELSPAPENRVKIIEKMILGDPRAIFGGLVMTNFPIDEKIAETIISFNMPQGGKRLLDGIVAPKFTAGAVELLKRKNGKCRLIENQALQKLDKKSLDHKPRFRMVRGGFLKQPNYTFILDLRDPRIERTGTLTAEQENDLLLAWAVGSTSNSNTITLVKNGMLIGNGVGQQDRVGCAELAVKRAKDAGNDPAGAAAYSDSFFPFPDAPEMLARAGVKAIFASSGSVNDALIKETCAKHGVIMAMMPDAEARGFYWH